MFSNMFSKLGDKAKAAFFLAIGMGLFLVAGSLVYFFPKSQYVHTVTADNNANINANDSSSVQELYQNLVGTETESGTKSGSDDQAALVREVPQHNAETTEANADADDRWVIYVTGCVRNPGVYQLPEGARVFQLVDAAGGLTMVADSVAINMAAQLQDGDHLHVPQVGDDDSVRNRNRSSTGTVVFSDGPVVDTGAGALNQLPGGATPFGGRNMNLPTGRNINLNTASDAELQSLPGVGPALSARILRYRNQNGRFKQVSDLINVPGIGGKKLEAIEPFIFVR